MWLLSAAGFFQYVSLGPTFGVVQNVVDIRRRATATAFLYICLAVVALGLGPLFTGWAIDRFAEGNFLKAAAGVSFTAQCPGGAAPVFFGWACVHYLLAAAGIGKSLRAAVLRNDAPAPWRADP